MAEVSGLLFDIQGHSVHDGPGCRTLLFLSGCPLRCRWCANPEGLLAERRLMFKQGRCRQCPVRCAAACPSGAVSGTPPVTLDRARCRECGSRPCIEVCYREALSLCGRSWTVRELLAVVERDRAYWGPEGGVTLGGGDPFFQAGFTRALLEACRDAGVHTAVETSAHVPTGTFLELMAFVEWAFVDLKHMDASRHAEGTGVTNALILENLRALASRGWAGRLVVRIPVVPGFNDDVENIKAAAAFMKSAGLRELNLLPFHRLGASKYESLGLPYACGELEPPGRALLESLKARAERAGLTCWIGDETPF